MPGRSLFPPPLSRDAEAAIFAAELGDAPTLDLHGLDQNLAGAELDAFVPHAFMQGETAVRIIHGIGTGAVQRETESWLRRHGKIVAGWRGSSLPHEAGAVTYAALHLR